MASKIIPNFMIENIAIIALAFLSQFNVVSSEQGSAGFLEQFIEQEFVEDKFNLQERNWNYYHDNINQENFLQTTSPTEPLPSVIWECWV